MGDVARRKQSFATGYLMGLSGMPVATAPAAANEPRAYAYNGIPLPSFPKWDKETYPYALISYDRTLDYYIFSVYKSINYYETSGFFGAKSHWFGGNADNTSLVFRYKLGDDGWTQQANTRWSIDVDRIKSGSSPLEPVIWANFDLMYSDGTLYMGESEPESITDAEPWKQKYFFNTFVSTIASLGNLNDKYYRQAIIKTDDAYIYFDLLSGFGDGSYFRFDFLSGKVYIQKSQASWHRAFHQYFGRDEWVAVNFLSCVGEECEINGSTYWYVCQFEDLIWSHEDIYDFDGTYDFKGTEPIPVVFPGMDDPSGGGGGVVDTESNKAVTLGCRLGYIVRSQMAPAGADVPMGVLISSDGYILRDCNGLYLTAKEDA